MAAATTDDVGGPAADDVVVIGRVVKPHGINGEVVVAPQSDVTDRFAPGVQLGVGDTSHVIADSRDHKGRLLVSFRDVTDRNGAEALRGATVTGPRVDLSDTDHWFAHELVGMDVVTEDGRWWGEVVDVAELPQVAGYDLLEVDLDGSRWLLPDDDALVEVGTDGDTGRDLLIVIDPPVGLLPGDDSAAAIVVDDGADNSDRDSADA